MPKPDRISDILLNKIRIERRFLLMPYYTWWFEYNRLEIIEPLTGSIPHVHWSEWESFVRHASEDLLKEIDRHDKLAEELRRACEGLQRAIEVSSELRGLYQRVVTPEFLAELGTAESELFGARWPNSVFPYLAQLIVNQTPPDCSPLYTIRPLWIRVGTEFLRLRQHPAFAEKTQWCQKIVEGLLISIERLEATLTQKTEAELS
ncbi:MAG: hypothetical protein J4G05_01220 [Chlorobi bacterium]|nr:hypothetical protein [Chlorobiota bacterium]